MGAAIDQRARSPRPRVVVNTKETTEAEEPAGIDAILGANPFFAAEPKRVIDAMARVWEGLMADPGLLLRRLMEGTSEVMGALLGASAIQPDPGDKRFSDPTWKENPFYQRWMQIYLAWRKAMHAAVEAIPDDNWKTAEQRRFAVRLITEALAPTNLLIGNPAALKRAFETGGQSLIRGFRNYVNDLLYNGGMPSQVNKAAFEVGRNIAATPGAVIYRGNLCEVIQYRPATESVFERPLLYVPPQINKYYILDLAPGRSLVEYAVARGISFFAISWRNPTPADRDLGIDAYVAAVKEAVEIVADISGVRDINLLGVCAGGITASLLLGHLAALGEPRVNAATLLVTMLDSSCPSMTGMFATEDVVPAAVKRSRALGELSAAEMGQLFAWLRPNDLVWNYWVNNYLMGNDPPAFDILFWNNDSTNLPAALHSDFLDIMLRNPLARSGATTVLGTPIDLKRVTNDMFIIAGLTDHICSWQACYRAAHFFGGQVDFLVTSLGHVQSMVDPPGNPKARYFLNPVLGNDATQWLQGATEHQGSWWDTWLDWLRKRSGEERPAPTALGNERYRPLTPAPGTYVHGKA